MDLAGFLIRSLLIAVSLPLFFAPVLVPAVAWRWYSERFQDTGGEIALRIYNVLFSGLLLGLALGLLAFVVHRYLSRRKQAFAQKLPAAAGLSWLAEILLMYAAALFAALALPVPYPFLFSLSIAFVFGLAFPLANLGRRSPVRWPFFLGGQALLPIGSIMAWLVLLFIEQVCADVVVDGYDATWDEWLWDLWWVASALLAFWVGLVCLSWVVGRALGKPRIIVGLATRIGAGLLCFPLLALGFMAGWEIPLSPQAALLFDAPNLYDLEVDDIGRRLLVTTSQKNERQQHLCVGFAFSFDDLSAPPIMIRPPSIDFEDIAIDTAGRTIYHLERGRLNMMAIDADTFQVIRSRRLMVDCDGAMNHALVPSAGRLFISCEMDSPTNLLVIDMQSLKKIKTFGTGKQTSVQGDDVNGVLYMFYEWKPMLDRLDAHTLEITDSAPSSNYADKMYLSYRRSELFVPSPPESGVWVYSVPDLKLLYKIKTLAGVRPLAVDEKNDLLIVASYVSGYMDVIDLETKKTIQHHYVGKYGRTIVVDPERRQAYLATASKGLYLLRY